MITYKQLSLNKFIIYIIALVVIIPVDGVVRVQLFHRCPLSQYFSLCPPSFRIFHTRIILEILSAEISRNHFYFMPLIHTYASACIPCNCINQRQSACCCRKYEHQPSLSCYRYIEARKGTIRQSANGYDPGKRWSQIYQCSGNWRKYIIRRC